MISITVICNRFKSRVDLTWDRKRGRVLMYQTTRKFRKSRNVTQNKYETCAPYW